MTSEPTRTLTDGSPEPSDGSYREIDPATGMQRGYVVLSEEERAKGFVRPVRRSYRHVGMRPQHPVRDITSDEREWYRGQEYVKYEEYPRDRSLSVLGRFWTQAQLDSGCGAVTTMGEALAETYARQPDFYGATFCSACRSDFPVGVDGEFVWLDGEKVGS